MNWGTFEREVKYLLLALPAVFLGILLFMSIRGEVDYRGLDERITRNTDALLSGQQDRYTGSQAREDLAEIHRRLERLEDE